MSVLEKSEFKVEFFKQFDFLFKKLIFETGNFFNKMSANSLLCEGETEIKFYPLKREIIAQTRYQQKNYDKRNERLAKKFRKRERREYLFQVDYEAYLKDLTEVEAEIDEYLKKNTSDDPPTERMIAYARHPWTYNELKQEYRYRLSLIRCRIEEHFEKENSLRNLRPKPEIKRAPICPVCREDLNDSTNCQTPFRFSCGHVFHFSCMIEYFMTPSTSFSTFGGNAMKCPVCRLMMRPDDAQPIFLSYD